MTELLSGVCKLNESTPLTVLIFVYVFVTLTDYSRLLHVSEGIDKGKSDNFMSTESDCKKQWSQSFGSALALI